MEKIKITKFTKLHKDTKGDYILDALPVNMELLLNKINELVDQVNLLEDQLTLLDKVKAKKQVVYGGGGYNRRPIL